MIESANKNNTAAWTSIQGSLVVGYYVFLIHCTYKVKHRPLFDSSWCTEHKRSVTFQFMEIQDATGQGAKGYYVF